MITDQNVVFVILIPTLDRVAIENILCDYYTICISGSIMTKQVQLLYPAHA